MMLQAKQTKQEKIRLFVESLYSKKIITHDQYEILAKSLNEKIQTPDQLIELMQEKYILDVIEPLDENIEDFIQDLGAQNAADLARFVQNLRVNKKNLKDMTQKPVKSFLSGGIILAIGLVIIIAIVVLPGQLDNFTKGGPSGFQNPFGSFFPGGGFIDWLVPHMPASMLKFFL